MKQEVRELRVQDNPERIIYKVVRVLSFYPELLTVDVIILQNNKLLVRIDQENSIPLPLDNSIGVWKSTYILRIEAENPSLIWISRVLNAYGHSLPLDIIKQKMDLVFTLTGITLPE